MVRGGPGIIMSRSEKRAALDLLQEGRCAMCGAQVALVADHDHATGLLRGLLCWPCNVAEGKTVSLLAVVRDPRCGAYRANPPAACFGWRWELPHFDHLTIGQAVTALEGADLPPLTP
jgi:hypothetical protein